MRHIKAAVACFKKHIEVYDKWRNLLSESDARRYFVNFTNPGQRTSQACTQPSWHSMPSNSPPHHPTLTATNSASTADAPTWVVSSPTMPRPGRTTPLSGMKPRTHGDRKFTPGKANATSGQGKRHTRAGQTPHLSKANATLHTHPSVAFAPTECDIRDAEVWHFQTISQMTSQMKSANNFQKQIQTIQLK